MEYSIFNFKKAATKSLPVSVERAVWLYMQRAEVLRANTVSTPFSCLSMAWHDLPQHREARNGPPRPGAAWCTHYSHSPCLGVSPGQPQTACDCSWFLVLGFCFFTLQKTLLKHGLLEKKINCNHFQLHKNWGEEDRMMIKRYSCNSKHASIWVEDILISIISDPIPWLSISCLSFLPCLS